MRLMTPSLCELYSHRPFSEKVRPFARWSRFVSSALGGKSAARPMCWTCAGVMRSGPVRGMGGHDDGAAAVGAEGGTRTTPDDDDEDSMSPRFVYSTTKAPPA